MAALEKATISSYGNIGIACRSVGSASECVGSACGSVRSNFYWLKSQLELTFYTQGV